MEVQYWEGTNKEIFGLREKPVWIPAEIEMEESRKVLISIVKEWCMHAILQLEGTAT